MRANLYEKIFAECIYSAFVSLAAGVTDETIQLWSSGRSSEVRDVLIDFFGAVSGIIICILFVILYNRITCKEKRASRGIGE